MVPTYHTDRGAITGGAFYVNGMGYHSINTLQQQMNEQHCNAYVNYQCIFN